MTVVIEVRRILCQCLKVERKLSVVLLSEGPMTLPKSEKIFSGFAANFSFLKFRRQRHRRPEFLKELVSELLCRDVPSQGLVASCPELQSCWADLKFELKSYAARVENNSADAAIVQMTRMLAHDIRKPFSSMKIILAAIEDKSSPDEMKAVTGFAIPEISRAMDNVNGMLQDLADFGSNEKPVLDAHGLQGLILASLTEIFRSFPQSSVRLNYAFNHTGQILADRQKIIRSLSNIFLNAFQAMNHSGNLTIRSKNVDDCGAMIELVIANDGPEIPTEMLEKIFDVFFTGGKKGGAGLGLAVARKVVNDHGGRIVCHSSAGQGVSFVLTLPRSGNVPVGQRPVLPVTGGDFREGLRRLEEAEAVRSSTEINADQLLENFSSEVSLLGRPVDVLVADDERIYRDSLIEKLCRFPQIAPFVAVRSAATAAEAGSVHNSDLAIVDIDFGSQDTNGFGVVSSLRENGNRGIICTHSNRIFADDRREAMEHGADVFLPKPMSAAELLNLLCQAASRARELSSLP
ncbi:MAG: response regulator [Proteobacteria bacterium]|nr:response regulator [Pseudomonadota bacterium]